MENILNMEYSLNAILYLVELQIKEGLEADFIHYKETYPFCNSVKYRAEVLEYLSKYNNDTLNKTLNKQREICNTILEKWNNELQFMNWSLLKKDVLDYKIYCTFIQKNDFPFENIELVRENKGVIEKGNPFLENNRYWKKGEKAVEYTKKKHIKKIINQKLNTDLKMIFTMQLIEFANSINSFLNDYVSEIKILQTIEIILPPALLQLLQEKGYIENITKPYRWIKTNSTTHGKNPNKRALIDLLCLLEYPDEVATNIKLLNENFTFSNSKPIKANNLTNITLNGKLQRPIISEYHTELQTIVEQSKEK